MRCVLESGPHIWNHNVETVPRLTPFVRHKATYERSLAVLSYAKKNMPNLVTKSGLMVGLGESEEEVGEVLIDLHSKDSAFFAPAFNYIVGNSVSFNSKNNITPIIKINKIHFIYFIKSPLITFHYIVQNSHEI